MAGGPEFEAVHASAIGMEQVDIEKKREYLGYRRSPLIDIFQDYIILTAGIGFIA